MPFLKEIIVLVSVLLVSLVIVFISPDTLDNNNKNIQNTAETDNVLSVFKNETNLINDNNQQTVFDENQTAKNIPVLINENENTYQIETSNTDNEKETAMQLENIFDRISSLVEKLKKERENESPENENCSICGEENATVDSVMKDYLMSIGYSLWSEYIASEDYQQAKEYYLLNKNDSDQEENSSVCATILASAGGGMCNCDNAMGPCYQDTPSGRYYHCAGLCCCACCIICCR